MQKHKVSKPQNATPQVGKNSLTTSYTRQKGKAMEVFQAKFPQSQAMWIKADVNQATMYITFQEKKANTADKWVTMAKVKILPAPTWGRMNDVEKETHISAFLSY